MKRCQSCNREYANALRFCERCGGSLIEASAPEMRCPNCGATARAGWKFCGKCRAPLALPVPATQAYVVAPPSGGANQKSSIICPACRLPVEEEGDFCEHCGTRVVNVAPAPPEAVAPTVIGYATNIEHESSTSHEPLSNSAFDIRGDALHDAEHYEALSDDEATDEPDVSMATIAPIPATLPEAFAAAEATEETELHATDSGEIRDSDTSHDSPPLDIEREADMIAPLNRTVNVAPPIDADTSFHLSLQTEARPFFDWRNGKMIGLGAAAIMAVVFVVIVLGVWSRQRQSPVVARNAPAPPSPERNASPPPERNASPQANVPDGMVFIAGGVFQMGRDGGDEYESPAHTVTVEPFYIDRHEVTCEQYARFIAATGYPPPSAWPNGRYPPDAARRPVTGINWLEANAYSQWAGRRLPTEEEWEFAARGHEGRLYPWGNEWRPESVNAASTTRRFDEVGSRPGNASPFGVYDMVGNVWEWTSSTIRPYPGGRLPQTFSDAHKVLRGGCWESEPHQATATYRFAYRAQGERYGYDNTGFRCAMSVVAASNNR